MSNNSGLDYLAGDLIPACPVIANMNEFDWSQLNEEDPDIKVDTTLPVGKPLTPYKCECGCDSLYGENNKFHSPWCPKYEKQ
jgi:hypothetical protein